MSKLIKNLDKKLRQKVNLPPQNRSQLLDGKNPKVTILLCQDIISVTIL